MNHARFWETSMARQYDEKRNFRRMALDCALSYDVPGESSRHSGQCLNLSATGVLFVAQRALDVGHRIHINITPQKTVVAPLNATGEVLRVEPGSEKDTWRVAARLTQVD